jgi:aspartate-semialdehyde dehydrogenase
MSEGWNIAILGATGAVGEALLETLAERQFPVGDIYALARTDSAGEHLRFNGKSVMVQDAAAFDWTQAQLAFFAAGAEATASYVEEATNAGCLVIDLSGLFSMEPDVPLVVPDVNPFVLADYRNRNVIAVPNSLTSQLLTALKPLIDDGGLSRITVTSLLSASANGKKAVDALAGQSAKLLNGIPIDEDDFFGRQLAFNMLPLLPDREGSVREERRIVDEVRKILQDDGLMISANVVQSPVFYGHAQMVALKRCVRWRQKRRAMRLAAVKTSCSLKRASSRRRLAMPPVARIFPLAACVTITVCRSRFSSGPLPITFALAAR